MSHLNIEHFIKNFSDQFDETDLEVFKLDTKFRELDEWDSLTALSLIAMTDEEYGVKLTGNDIKNSETLFDLFEVIKSKI
jgi:acyl carrier protein